MTADDYIHLLDNPLLDQWERVVIAGAIAEMIARGEVK